MLLNPTTDGIAEEIRVETGRMYLVEAGTAHGVLAGSYGTLVVIDV